MNNDIMDGETAIPLPQPEDISRREREDAMGAYLMMFAAWGIGLPLPVLNLAAAGIYYGLHRRKSKFTAFHALQSLTSQIPVTLANAGLLVWFLRTVIGEYYYTRGFWIYLAFTAALNLAYIITSLAALTRAYRGNFFYFPVFGRWAFERWYGAKARGKDELKVRPNLPPS